MASVASPRSKPNTDHNALKIAVAIALLRSKQLRQLSSSTSSVPAADAQRWKRKAKERKRELIVVREELKQLKERGREPQPDALPQILSCRCHFFDGCGALSSGGLPLGGGGGGDGGGSGYDHWIDDVLRRRFLRHVRWKERQRRLEGSIRKRNYIDVNNDDEVERLGVSVDFLMELSGSNFPDKDSAFAASYHQAVDSILVSLKKLLSLKKDDEIIEEMVDSLIIRLFQRMCATSGKDEEAPLKTMVCCIAPICPDLGVSERIWRIPRQHLWFGQACPIRFRSSAELRPTARAAAELRPISFRAPCRK